MKMYCYVGFYLAVYLLPSQLYNNYVTGFIEID
jgi:hypothetical protein